MKTKKIKKTKNKIKAPKKKNFFLSLIKTLFILAFICILFVVAVNAVVILSTRNDIYEDKVPLGDYDCIIVLGAGVHIDGSPTDMLKDRLDIGIGLWEDGFSPVILMSGDHGREEYDEVNNMKKYATENGVDADAVFLDHAGFSTYDSIYRAKEIFGAEKVIIVTQKYHLYRALYIAKTLGLDATGVSASVREYRGQIIHDGREALARTKDMIYTWFKPEPMYLGEKIDLKGSASQTDG